MVSKNITTFKQKLYDKSVSLTLRFYESWILPPGQKTTLRDIKLREFRDRKKLLHPYQRDQLITSSNDPEQMQQLAKIVNVKNMYRFTLTYDRHKGLYGFRTKDFPESYDLRDTVMDWKYDRDFEIKLRPNRLRLKRWAFYAFLGWCLVQYRLRQVAEFDRLKRKEQRAMQNSEIEDILNKKVKFVLYDKDGKEITENYNITSNAYTIYWYDTKIKNYLLFLEYLKEKRQILAKHEVILVVNKPQFMQNIEQLKAQSQNENIKNDIKVLLIKPSVKENEDNEDDDENESEKEKEEVDLEIKKTYFYVINPDGKIIDCARIYSFLHEENIFKRITAKVIQDVDHRNSSV